MYYIYGSVRAIPTYRVYRLYDIIISPVAIYFSVVNYEEITV
jgi:hypothetical protein